MKRLQMEIEKAELEKKKKLELSDHNLKSFRNLFNSLDVHYIPDEIIELLMSHMDAITLFTMCRVNKPWFTVCFQRVYFMYYGYQFGGFSHNEKSEKQFVQLSINRTREVAFFHIYKIRLALINKESIPERVQKIFRVRSQNYSNIECIIQDIQKSGSFIDFPKSDQSFDTTKAKLHDYQSKTVQWMIHQETVGVEFSHIGSCPYPLPSKALDIADYSKAIHVDFKTGSLTMKETIVSLGKFHSGLLCCDVGLGKTLECTALIASNPRTNRNIGSTLILFISTPCLEIISHNSNHSSCFVFPFTEVNLSSFRMRTK